MTDYSAQLSWARPKGFGDDATIMVLEWRPSRSTAPSGRRRRGAAAV